MKDIIFTLMSNKAIHPKFVMKNTDLIYIPSAFNIFLSLLPAHVETCEKDDALQTSQSETETNSASVFNQRQSVNVI